MLLYLKRYRNLNLQLNENDKYLMINDALFADNTADQKNFQNYTMKLFKNLVEWQTNKQITITISYYYSSSSSSIEIYAV